LEQFEKVVQLETEKSRNAAASNTANANTGTTDYGTVIWRFKALQNIVILAARLRQYDTMIKRYEEMLQYMDAVTRNEASDAINGVLDSVANYCAKINEQNNGTGVTDEDKTMLKLETMYAATLKALQAKMSAKRFWFSTSVKLARLYLDMKELTKLQKVIQSLHKSCKKDDGTDDDEKSSQLVEVYALEIQLCTQTRNTARMKQIYPKTINLYSAIADPRNIAIIRESGGMMYMTEKKWQAAYNEFFEAFKNYQETGHWKAKLMLKYVVVANVLALSSISPFDSREAKVYAEDPEIRAVAQLRVAYEKKDIRTIDDLLSDPKYNLTGDSVIAGNLEDLRSNIRLQVLEHLVKPYKSVKIEFLAKELSITRDEVIALLVELILENKISGRIDELKGFVVMVPEEEESNAVTVQPPPPPSSSRLDMTIKSSKSTEERFGPPLMQWITSLNRIHSDLTEKVNTWQNL